MKIRKKRKLDLDELIKPGFISLIEKDLKDYEDEEEDEETQKQKKKIEEMNLKTEKDIIEEEMEKNYNKEPKTWEEAEKKNKKLLTVEFLSFGGGNFVDDEKENEIEFIDNFIDPITNEKLNIKNFNEDEINKIHIQQETFDPMFFLEKLYKKMSVEEFKESIIHIDDRENSAKSLQFAGTSALEKLSTTPSYESVAAGSYTKGQFVRLFLSDTSNPALVLAGAKTLQLHVSMSLEDATTKDTPGTWQVQEPTGLSYDISTNALVASNETITSAVGGQTLGTLMDFYESSTLLYWQIANVSGDNQRTKGSVICSGQCRINSIQVTAGNRQVATYDTQLSGYGDYNVGA